MKRSQVFRLCSLLCSILLVSPKASSLSLPKLEKRDILNGNGELDGLDDLESPPGESQLPTQAAILNNVNASLPNATPIVPKELQNSSGLLNTSIVNPEPEGSHLEAGPASQNKSFSDNGILAPLESCTDNTTSVASLGNPLQEEPKEPNQPPDEKSVSLDQSILENVSQINTIEMLTTNPRTSIFETEDKQSTTSSPLNGQLITSVMTSETGTVLSQTNESMSTLSQITEEWDDTKDTTLSSDAAKSDVVTPVPDQVLEDDSGENAVFTIHPGVTVPSDDKSVFSTVEKIPEEEPSPGIEEPTVSPLMETDTLPRDDLPTPLTSATIDGAQAQDFQAVSTDVRQPGSVLSEDINITMTPAIVMDVLSEESTQESDVIDKAEEAVMESVTPQAVIPDNETPNGSLTTAEVLPVEVPSTEGSLSGGEDRLAASLSPDVPVEVLTGAESTTLSLITSAPQVSVIAPPTRRITTTPAYGLDRLESEEGDEEDEEEEDEDDDEADDDDDEDEDDDKDNDSVDDSAERDSDLPLFTLPGLSSQEPLEDDSNVALIEGAAYQVPDTMEWEQQNQGLVRSWMEKLKDKAGYMSGMLVPVGVGIVGALLILGALYSVKIMNRRRRNGFKRHKRKQREFNSMQDRVMLLADSSEDEF